MDAYQLDTSEMTIDCGACAFQGTAACGDCVVSYILDAPQGAIVFDADSERALRSLSGSGLLPEVQFQRLTG